jgi:hypothetical protein
MIGKFRCFGVAENPSFEVVFTWKKFVLKPMLFLSFFVGLPVWVFQAVKFREKILGRSIWSKSSKHGKFKGNWRCKND